MKTVLKCAGVWHDLVLVCLVSMVRLQLRIVSPSDAAFQAGNEDARAEGSPKAARPC